MKVLFLTQYDINGPSSRIRVYQFLPLYEKQGIHCTVRPLVTGPVKEMLSILLTSKNPLARIAVCTKIFWRFLGRYGDVLGARRYDVVVVQKDVLPFGLQFLLRLSNPNFIYEFDDAIWEPSPNSNERSFILKLIFWYRRRLFHKLLRTARAVIAENSYLETYARKFNANVEVISAPVNTDKYRPQQKEKSDVIVVGWLGSPMTSHLLAGLEKPLIALAKKVPNLEVHNIAGNPLHFPGVTIRNIPWSEENEVEYLSAFDIGIMPLDDTDFNKGRLGYKMLIYASMGFPIVADDLGLNKEVVINGVNGFLVQSPEEWTEKLVLLTCSPELRVRMGKAARELAISKYDLQICAQKSTNMLKRLSRPS